MLSSPILIYLISASQASIFPPNEIDKIQNIWNLRNTEIGFETVHNVKNTDDRRKSSITLHILRNSCAKFTKHYDEKIIGLISTHYPNYATCSYRDEIATLLKERKVVFSEFIELLKYYTQAHSKRFEDKIFDLAGKILFKTHTKHYDEIFSENNLIAKAVDSKFDTFINFHIKEIELSRKLLLCEVTSFFRVKYRVIPLDKELAHKNPSFFPKYEDGWAFFYSYANKPLNLDQNSERILFNSKTIPNSKMLTDKCSEFIESYFDCKKDMVVEQNVAKLRLEDCLARFLATDNEEQQNLLKNLEKALEQVILPDFIFDKIIEAFGGILDLYSKYALSFHESKFYKIRMFYEYVTLKASYLHTYICSFAVHAKEANKYDLQEAQLLTSKRELIAYDLMQESYSDVIKLLMKGIALINCIKAKKINLLHQFRFKSKENVDNFFYLLLNNYHRVYLQHASICKAKNFITEFGKLFGQQDSDSPQVTYESCDDKKIIDLAGFTKTDANISLLNTYRNSFIKYVAESNVTEKADLASALENMPRLALEMMQKEPNVLPK